MGELGILAAKKNDELIDVDQLSHSATTENAMPRFPFLANRDSRLLYYYRYFICGIRKRESMTRQL